MAETLAQAIDGAVVAARQPVLGALPSTLREVARLTPVAGGQVIARRGERPKAMWCLLSGEVQLVRTSRQGAECLGALTWRIYRRGQSRCTGVAL